VFEQGPRLAHTIRELADFFDHAYEYRDVAG